MVGVGAPSLLEGGHSAPAMAAGESRLIRGRTKSAAPAAALSPPRPLARGGPAGSAGSVPGAVSPLHPLPGPLRSSAHSQNS